MADFLGIDWNNAWKDFSGTLSNASDTLFSKGGVFDKTTSFLGSDAGKGLVNTGDFLTNAYLGLQQLDAIKANNALQTAAYNRSVATENANNAAADDAVAAVFGSTKKKKSATTTDTSNSPFQDIKLG